MLISSKKIMFFCLLWSSLLKASSLPSQHRVFFSCSSQSQESTGFYVTAALKSSLTRHSKNSVTLNKTVFSYSVSESYVPLVEERSKYLFAEQSLILKNHRNKKNYRPRKYKNHWMFARIFKKKAYGKIDVLIPKEMILKERKKFKIQVIFSNILDHWGGSIAMNCAKILNKPKN